VDIQWPGQDDADLENILVGFSFELLVDRVFDIGDECPRTSMDDRYVPVDGRVGSKEKLGQLKFWPRLFS
jgi:hypothetical protein